MARVQDGPGAQGKPEVYIPYTQHTSQGGDIQSLPWFVLARAAGDPKAVAPVLSRAIGQEFEDLDGTPRFLERRAPRIQPVTAQQEGVGVVESGQRLADLTRQPRHVLVVVDDRDPLAMLV